MKKRPLCLAALVLTLALLLLPGELFFKSSPLEGRGRPELLTGEIRRIEPGGRTVWLAKTNLSGTGIILVQFEAETHFSIGNTIQIDHNFKIREPERPTNPGQFDARLYYQTKGIVLLCYAKEAKLIRDTVRSVPQALYETREALSARIRLLFPEEKSGVLEAMLLGDKSDLDSETRELYQKSGMAHLLAISGLHVSIFGMGLYGILRRLGGSLRLSGGAALAMVLLYGGLTGMGISTGRAVIMFALLMLGTVLGKSYDMLSALSLAALILLLFQPLYVKSASFLLSFGAVLGIGLVFPVLKIRFLPKHPRLGKRLEPLLLSLSIQVMTLPELEYFYCELPLYGILLNLVVIPLMTLVMIAGILAVGLGFVLPVLSRPPVFLCSVLLEVYDRLGEGSLRLPGAVYRCGQPKFWQMVVYYLGLSGFLLWEYRKIRQEKEWRVESEEQDAERELSVAEKKQAERERSVRRAGSAVVLGFLVLLLTLRLPAGLTLTMLDVGQGDGIFLRTPAGTTVLIDGGSTSVSKVGTYRILPFLKTAGVKSLDYIVVTHTDADHISGVQELLGQAGAPGGLKIGTLLLSGNSMKEETGKKLMELAGEQGISVGCLEKGKELRDSSARLWCLHPDGGKVYDDVNEASIVLRLECGNFTVMLTGDLGEEGEMEILKELGKDGMEPCDVLKAGHHGSKYSDSEAWLQALQPSLTLISCGLDNSYGHPHREALERLEAVGSRVLLTTEGGAITVKKSRRGFRAEQYRKAD